MENLCKQYINMVSVLIKELIGISSAHYVTLWTIFLGCKATFTTGRPKSKGGMK